MGHYDYDEPLIGSMRKLHIERANILTSASHIEENRSLRETILFNQNKKIIEQIHFRNETMTFKRSRKYNSGGLLLEAVINNPDDGTVKLKTVFNYNDEGKLISHFDYEPENVLVRKVIHVFSEDGNLLEFVSYRADGSVERRDYFDSKDGDEKQIKYFSYNPDGSVLAGAENLYDEKGRLIETKYFGINGNLEYKNVNVYDDDKKTVDGCWYDSNGNLSSRTLITFASQGRAIAEERYSAQNELRDAYTFTYEFDEVGNWIKKVMLRDDAKINVGEIAGVVFYRTITYW